MACRGLELAGGALLARAEPLGGARVDRQIGFADARVTRTPSRGLWRVPSILELHFGAGRTGDDTWRRYGGTATVGLFRRETGLTMTWRRDTVRDAVLDLDRLQLGGVASTFVPDSALGGRILVPGLPVGTRIGDEHEGQRATLQLGGLPLFYERHRVWDRSGPKGDWLRLAGVAWDITDAPMPLFRLAGFHLTLGVARVLDEPVKDVTQAWLGLSWKP